MSDPMYYTPPADTPRPFVKGDIVETCDRSMKSMETVKVTYAGPRVVRTSCGRRWNQDGWWMTEDGFCYPFPSIRLKETP